MRHIGLALAIAGLGLLWGSAGALAADASPYEVEYTSETPLIVIRFNQPHVMYEQPLYKTIARALDIKPSAVFDVVSISARARDPQAQKANNQVATQNVAKVLATLHEIGLPQSRISVSSASDKVASSEVRIFVH